MADPLPPLPDGHEEPPAGHERRDVNIGAVVKFTAGLGAFALLVHFAVVWFFDILEVKTQRAQPKLSPLLKQELETRPHRAERRMEELPQKAGQPPLQPHDIRDMEQLLKEENARLNSYGWVKREEGVVRIPIERAIDLLAENPETARKHGIRVRQQAKEKGGR